MAHIDPIKMSWEDLLLLREKYNAEKENIDAALSVISHECLERLQQEKVNGKVVGNYSISKSTRYGFDTTLAEAQELGATKLVVDASALKAIHLGGKVTVPGVKKTEYVMIREVVRSSE